MLKQVITILAGFVLVGCTSRKFVDESKSNDNMLKLYKETNTEFYYWETWDQDDRTAIIHWGIVGQRGDLRKIKRGLFTNFRKTVQKEIDAKLDEGYIEYDEEKMDLLEVEYNIEGFGTEQDLEKRHRLENHLNELLGWTGLGHADGGSIGKGTMEAGCVVVNFEIAKKVIEDNLKDTEFADYSRIFRMNDD